MAAGKQLSKQLTKYLNNYAEDETQSLASFPKDIVFNQALVIPAYKESIAFISRFFCSSLAQKNTLMICIINQPTTVENITQQHQLFNQASSKGHLLWQTDNMKLLSIAETNSYLLLIDRYSQAIPIEQGVGLARKIGADIATYLIAKQQIKSPWLYSSDADAHLPENYFNTTNELTNEVVAVIANFNHQSPDLRLHQANKAYEKALRYYVAGLRYAASHYAFFTIGSLVIVNVEAYAKVRGFPKKSAGEDFYLLNKIAKLGKVEFIEDCVIILDARNSDRVPFGTGPAVNKIMQLSNIDEDYYYYHPEVFEGLKLCLQKFSLLWQYRDNLILWYSKLPKPCVNALQSIGLDKFIKNQLNASQDQFNKQTQVWFDAFKTLKFIHALREVGLHDIPLKQALLEAKFNVTSIL